MGLSTRAIFTLIAGIPDNLVAGVLEVTLKEAWWKPQRDSLRPTETDTVEAGNG